MDSGEATNAATDVRRQLERILASDDFDASERNRRFLRYVVDEALAGRAGRVKADAIGISVFGRSDDFDAQLDPIVRIEARRLRQSLERYYLLSGRNDALRITIPKGSYVPAFESVDCAPLPNPPETETAAPARAPTAPSIYVDRFDADGGDGATIARGFRRHLIVALTRFSDLIVFGPATMADDGFTHDGREPGGAGVDYVLGGSCILDAGRLRVDALLTDVRSGRHLWAQAFDEAADPGAIRAVRDAVAESVARALAQPYGMIFARKAQESEGKPPELLTSYECVVRFHAYARTYSRERRPAVRGCLEKTLRAEPDYAEATACLSRVYMDAVRFGWDSGAERDPLGRALALARRGVALAPHSSQCRHALGMALWFSGDVEQGVAALEAGLALNPNDSEIMADLGLRFAVRADWARATDLLEASFARNPAQPGHYHIGLSMAHFAHGRYEAALAEARCPRSRDHAFGWICEAVAAARLGLSQDAAAALGEILALHPDYGARVEDDLAARNVEPGLGRAIVAALRDAGLAAAPQRLPRVV